MAGDARVKTRLLRRTQINNVPATRWTHLSRRRLQTYPSKLTPDNVLLEQPLPTWLIDPMVPRLQAIPLALEGEAKMDHAFASSPHGAPNHVLVNVYEPGQGIMPHEDGAAYWPVVATVSLGSAIVLELYGKNEDGSRQKEAAYRILQEPRSLLVTTDELYTDYLHGILETTKDDALGPEMIANWALLGSPEQYSTGTHDRQTRISLTYRDVRKVSHFGSKIKLFNRP